MTDEGGIFDQPGSRRSILGTPIYTDEEKAQRKAEREAAKAEEAARPKYSGSIVIGHALDGSAVEAACCQRCFALVPDVARDHHDQWHNLSDGGMGFLAGSGLF